MAYWIFQANPDRYRLIDALRATSEGDEKLWQVNQHKTEIHIGDSAAIWQSGRAAGIYAIAEVTSEPEMLPADGDPYWVDERERVTPHLRVRLRIRRLLLERPLPRGYLREDPKLRELSILRQAQGTNFLVTEEEWERIARLAEISPPDPVPTPMDAHLDVAEVHLRSALARDLTQIAPDLVPYFEDRLEEYPVPGGRIDLLCKDGQGQPVIIELKRHNWDVDKTIGQVARYMGWARTTLASGGPVRAILLLFDDGVVDPRLEAAKEAVPGLEIKRYSISFHVK
jgi:predicted RNA-binding protein with PUA-like domain